MAHIVMVCKVGGVPADGVLTIDGLEHDKRFVIGRVQVVDLSTHALNEGVFLLLHLVGLDVSAACHEVNIMKELLLTQLG